MSDMMKVNQLNVVILISSDNAFMCFSAAELGFGSWSFNSFGKLDSGQSLLKRYTAVDVFRLNLFFFV